MAEQYEFERIVDQYTLVVPYRVRVFLLDTMVCIFIHVGSGNRTINGLKRGVGRL